MRYFTIGNTICRSENQKYFDTIFIAKYFDTFFNLEGKEIPLFEEYVNAVQYRNDKSLSGVVFAIDVADNSSVQEKNGQKSIQNDALNITLLAGDKNPYDLNQNGIYEFVPNVQRKLKKPQWRYPAHEHYYLWKGQALSEKTINLLKDYEPAKALIEVLKNSNSPSNANIIEIIDENLVFLEDFDHAGAFIDHVNFVILQLSYGRYNSLEEYRKFKNQDQNDRVQAKNGNSLLDDQAASPNGRRVVTKWEDSDIAQIKTKATELYTDKGKYKEIIRLLSRREPDKYLFPNAYLYLQHGHHADALDKKLAATLFELEILKAIYKENIENPLLPQVSTRAQKLIKSARDAIDKSQPDRSFRKIRTPFTRFNKSANITLGIGLSAFATYFALAAVIGSGFLLGVLLGVSFPLIAFTALFFGFVAVGVISLIFLGIGGTLMSMVEHKRADLVKFPTKPAINYINNLNLDEFRVQEQETKNDNALSVENSKEQPSQAFSSPIGVDLRGGTSHQRTSLNHYLEGKDNGSSFPTNDDVGQVNSVESSPPSLN
jgi:hypothetical protein